MTTTTKARCVHEFCAYEATHHVKDYGSAGRAGYDLLGVWGVCNMHHAAGYTYAGRIHYSSCIQCELTVRDYDDNNACTECGSHIADAHSTHCSRY